MSHHRTLAPAFALALLLAPLAAFAQQPPAPAEDRSMAFRPGLGAAARERVPGGRLVIGAYSAVLLLIGSYVAYVARRAAKLDDDVRRLEDDLARRTAKADEA